MPSILPVNGPPPSRPVQLDDSPQHARALAAVVDVDDIEGDIMMSPTNSAYQVGRSNYPKFIYTS